MEYFGTNLTEHGHYRFLVTENTIQKNWQKFNDLPFHPEYLTNKLKNGEISFFQGGQYTVIAIAGSPVDTRPGSKSVFWVNEVITKTELIMKIMKSEPAMKIIRAMPFDIQWNI